ncbi:YOR378W-like protein [Saccharata proteae CBS 121410]|uniref:YOR378W-like protein n=1 Tax=Saccharata proteae CBS 121410 TaxID=1314787 RepID=A0A9P4HXL0_9PEZI|nr:YOR378W-like protein [Saccharata proteae CBS 121410]
MTRIHEALFVATASMANFLCQCALGLALAPIELIAADFKVTNPGQQSWFIAAFSLTAGTFILISGRAGDILGHKRAFCFGYLFLGIWSAFAGFAVYPQRQIFFDVCRAMQGIGCAILMPNSLALLGKAYAPGLRKNLVFSIFGACAPIGFVAGAVFGSLLAQLAWWPWAFWAYAIASFTLCLLGLIVTPKPLSQLPSHRPSFDWAGSVLGVAGMVLINISFNNGPLYGWNTPHVYFGLIIGLILIAGFAWAESLASNPLIPKQALNSTTAFILACLALGWGSFGVWVYYAFRFLEVVRHHTPLLASAEFTPVVVATLFASGFTGLMLTHTPVSFVMLVSMIGFFLGTVLVGTMPIHQNYWYQTFFGIIIMPFGMDMSFPAATVILSNSMPREHQGLAAAFVTTVMNYAVSLSLGIAALVEAKTMTGDGSVEDTKRGIFHASLVGICMAGLAVALAGVFFGKRMMKEGWRVEQH